ncbi:tRNA (adenosine(37)-N6)-threonylcarbamoyltransferase complex dimerization subunit type 1 TsaB [Buchnera aphidicola (Neophyllaphis varicolor)]|uniref:tRNA (adenosine(37)-N6)-threonylcarbamoyltransferase complex dimerization subunit type 1 TsaB n=1 Tax=Buchnera aphidicola TaxID=9 RepID=UPI0031B846CD
MSFNILCIDTSTILCSASILINNKKFSIFKICNNNHSKEIFVLIKNLLYKSNLKLNNINLIACGIGPGSFTGIRIAIGIANGISLGINVPVIGISTLAIIAEQVWRKKNIKKVIVSMKANSTEVYFAKYIKKNDIWTGMDTEVILKEKKLKNTIKKIKGTWIMAGTSQIKGFKKNKINIKNSNIKFPLAKDIIPFALLKTKNIKNLKNEILYPNYLKKAISKLY